jgi:DNA sulfur modification protein DndC
MTPEKKATKKKSSGPKQISAFVEAGFKETIELLKKDVQELYQSDEIPWVIGYSGGKDSTATTQLIWLALADLPPKARHKPVHVISTDTLVENPIVAGWVNHSLITMEAEAQKQSLPIQTHRLTPKPEDTFWVNLIGKGYPAPRHKFRWCTERLKISPSNHFITSTVKAHGEAILVLGTRKAESTKRKANMKQRETERLRDLLSPNSSLPGALVYSPIENWSNNDVWQYLHQVKNPWGYSNNDLQAMYAGATEDNECPVVVDTSTPSCGDSRFGCWVCTLVDQDKSMTAMIQNDDEKNWMRPLLALRNELDFRPAPDKNGKRDPKITTDRDKRDYRRMRGNVQLFHGRPIHGPYTQESRGLWLIKLLEAQLDVRKLGPSEVQDIELITLPELEEIRRIWVVEKHEVEDSLPRIYESVLGIEYPGRELDENMVFGKEEMELLKSICEDDRTHYELGRELLDVEKRFRTMSARRGLFQEIEKALGRGFYEGEEDATEYAQEKLNALEAAKEDPTQQPEAMAFPQQLDNLLEN